jgi:hypothetical protein
MSNTVLQQAKNKYIKTNNIHRFGWLNINDIVIPQIFIDAGVNDYKIQKCIDYYNKNGHMDKPVQVCGREHYCRDGFSRWVASIYLGLDKVWVEYIF